MSSMRYLIDSSVLIQAHRTYYAFGLCPGFWDSLVWHHSQGRVLSLDKVRDEIGDEGDALTKWAATIIPAAAFAASSDADVISRYAEMQVWANSQAQYSAAARAEFASVADAWLVAYAKAKNLTLVTQEVFAANVKVRIPIPNVCKAFDVNCMDSFTMLNNLNVQFNWGDGK